MKKVLLLIIFFNSIFSIKAQTLEELKAEQATKKDSISTIQSRVNALQGKIDAFLGWHIGAFGTIGGSLSSFNNWYSQGTPNNSSGNIGFTINTYANLLQEKFFWRNALTTNLNWVKLDDKNDPTDDESFKPTTDVFNISSLYGRNLSNKWAASGLVEYRTTLLNNMNDPGYLDVGIGVTWTPIPDLIVVINPLNHNFVFSNERVIFESSSGAKILVDYTKQINNINFKSNFSMFQSYKSSNFSNWTWTNSFSYTLWKNIGVGFDFGLRNNKQEALNYAINTLGDLGATFDNVDNDLQSYWIFGLSYSF
ncbi:DUF3078 domain-containing protein [Flavobacteriaceae bacterium AH-315-B10]|nr:DUF3078 domain-containing protein [Flavobacteriaceae bacterium AH-315-B10]